MKKLRVQIKMYGLVVIFLLYAVLQVNHGLTSLSKQNAVSKTTEKVNPLKTVSTQTPERKTGFRNFIKSFL